MKTDVELLIEELNRLIRYDDSPIMKGYLINIDKLLLKRAIEALEGLQDFYMGNSCMNLPITQCPKCGANIENTQIRTNRDFINSLSDESLANSLDAAINGSPCHLICNNYENCLKFPDVEPVCANHYVEWLRSKYDKESEC